MVFGSVLLQAFDKFVCTKIQKQKTILPMLAKWSNKTMNLKGSGIKKNKQKFIKFSGSEWTYEVNYKEIINDLLEMVENYGNREVNRNMIINYIRDRIRYAEYNCDEMNKNDTNLC